MSLTLAARIAVRQVVLSAPGKLSSGTITPVTSPALPNGIVAAEIISSTAWTFTDRPGGVGFPVAANTPWHMPGGFVRDAIFSAGTYTICLYLAG